MGNVIYPEAGYAWDAALYNNMLGIGQQITPSCSLIESAIANQIKNIEDKYIIRLLRKRKFRNVEYI